MKKLTILFFTILFFSNIFGFKNEEKQKVVNDGFLQACKSNNLEFVQLHLDNGANINVRNKKNRTGLILVCKNSQPDPELIHFLISSNIDRSVVDNYGKTASYYYSKTTNPDDFISCLLGDETSDSDSNSNTSENFTVIDFLEEKRDASFVPIHERNANHFHVDSSDEDLPKLEIVTSRQYQVSKLDSEKKELEIKNNNFLNIISKDLQSQNNESKIDEIYQEILVHLEYSKPDINAQFRSNIESEDDGIYFNGETMLHVVCRMGLFRIAELLIHNGANPYIKCDSGNSPLDWASSCGHADIIKLILKKDFLNVLRKDVAIDQNKQTEIDELCKEISLYLEYRKSDINEQFRCENDDDEKYSNGETMLHAVCRAGLYKVAKLLLENGANPNIKCDEGKTPLHWACTFGHTEIVRILLEHKADINATTQKGSTPMHCLSINPNLDIAVLLMQAPNINFEIQDIHGLTAYDCLEINLEKHKKLLTAEQEKIKSGKINESTIDKIINNIKSLTSKIYLYKEIIGRLQPD